MAAADRPTWTYTAVNLPLRDSVFTVTVSRSYKSSKVIFLPSRVMAVSSGTAIVVPSPRRWSRAHDDDLEEKRRAEEKTFGWPNDS